MNGAWPQGCALFFVINIRKKRDKRDTPAQRPKTAGQKRDRNGTNGTCPISVLILSDYCHLFEVKDNVENLLKTMWKTIVENFRYDSHRNN